MWVFWSLGLSGIPDSALRPQVCYIDPFLFTRHLREVWTPGASKQSNHTCQNKEISWSPDGLSPGSPVGLSPDFPEFWSLWSWLSLLTLPSPAWSCWSLPLPGSLESRSLAPERERCHPGLPLDCSIDNWALSQRLWGSFHCWIIVVVYRFL